MVTTLNENEIHSYGYPSVTCIELEESILGCILTGFPDILEVLPTIPVDAFTLSGHREIFKKMLELHEQGFDPIMHVVVLAFEKTPKMNGTDLRKNQKASWRLRTERGCCIHP